jgi:hypothetical protein
MCTTLGVKKKNRNLFPNALLQLPLLVPIVPTNQEDDLVFVLNFYRSIAHHVFNR